MLPLTLLRTAENHPMVRGADRCAAQSYMRHFAPFSKQASTVEEEQEWLRQLNKRERSTGLSCSRSAAAVSVCSV